MGKYHKRAKKVKFSATELNIVRQVNDQISPYGVVSAIGPKAVGVAGDARLIGISVIIRFRDDARVSELGTTVINRVRGVARVLMEI